MTNPTPVEDRVDVEVLSEPAGNPADHAIGTAAVKLLVCGGDVFVMSSACRAVSAASIRNAPG